MRHRAHARTADRPDRPDRHARRGPAGRVGTGARLAALASVALMLTSAVALGSAVTDAGTVAPSPAAAAPPEPGRGATGQSTAPTRPHPAVTHTPGAAVSAAGRWRTVLAGLDHRRARSYAAAEPGPLRSVYVRGSSALRRDRRLLAHYARRGLRVRGLRMHVADLRVRTARPGRVVLLVRDRVAGGVVVGDGRRRALRHDDLDRRLLTLRRVDRGVWLVAAVRGVPR